jgi:hypothetical protein
MLHLAVCLVLSLRGGFDDDQSTRLPKLLTSRDDDHTSPQISTAHPLHDDDDGESGDGNGPPPPTAEDAEKDDSDSPTAPLSQAPTLAEPENPSMNGSELFELNGKCSCLDDESPVLGGDPIRGFCCSALCDELDDKMMCVCDGGVVKAPTECLEQALVDSQHSQVSLSASQTKAPTPSISYAPKSCERVLSTITDTVVDGCRDVIGQGEHCVQECERVADKKAHEILREDVETGLKFYLDFTGDCINHWR